MAPAAGLAALIYALGGTVLLMAAIFLCSRVLLRYGLLPLSAALSLSGFNLPLFYLLILPGTIVHELSHYLACLATRVHVREVRLFSPCDDGVVGWVIHDQADPLRRNIIALAPFAGGSLAIYALIRFVLPPTEIDPLQALPGDLAQGFLAAMTSIVDILRAADLHQVKTWLSLYVLFSLGYAVAPSSQDLGRLMTDGLLAIGLVLAVIIIDRQLQLGLARNNLINDVAAALARGLQGLNALLLFACAGVALGTVVVVPIALLAHWLRSRFA